MPLRRCATAIDQDDYHKIIKKEYDLQAFPGLAFALRNAGKATRADSAATRSWTGGSDDFPSLAPSH